MHSRDFRFVIVGALAAVILGPAAPAQAQTSMSESSSQSPFQVASSRRAIGEDYRIEISGGVWNPDLFGTVASEQFGQTPTDIGLVDDLNFQKTRFADGRLVLRPGKKHKLRVQYTPVSYSGSATLTRDVVFNGILYPINVQVQSSFDWKVWRFGYEYDVIYTDRGYLGILLEARYTQMKATLKTAINNEFSSAKAPLPAAGLVVRLYPLKNLSITAEASGFKLPNFDEKYKAHYLDAEIYGTFNITNNFGVQGGWRRMSTYLKFEEDTGDFRFQGFWLGGAVRY